MRRLVSSLGALLLLLALATATVQAQEGPFLTSARQLDLTTQHLASTATKELHAGRLSEAEVEQVENLAALARGFRFDLEAHEYSPLQAQAAWAEVAQSFLAARNAVGDDGSNGFRNEVLRVHALMNRLDHRMGGAGFWYGRNGWTG